MAGIEGGYKEVTTSFPQQQRQVLEPGCKDSVQQHMDWSQGQWQHQQRRDPEIATCTKHIK